MKKIKLFDYQEDMVKRVQEAFKHHDSVMVQMPTGTGKTYLLAALVGLFLKEEVWVIAHRRELVSQIKDTLERFFSSLKKHLHQSDIDTMVVETLWRDGREAGIDSDRRGTPCFGGDLRRGDECLSEGEEVGTNSYALSIEWQRIHGFV